MTQKYGFKKNYFNDYKVVPDKKVRPVSTTALHCDGYNKMAWYNDVGCARVTPGPRDPHCCGHPRHKQG